MGLNNLNIQVVESAAEAPDYNGTDIGAALLNSAVVIQKGTEGGKPTVDLVFVDADGKQHVALVTGQILLSLAEVIEGVGGE